MHREGKPIDLVTLVDEMQSVGELHDGEETAYVAALGDETPRVANLDEYCRIVKQKAVLRRTIFLAEEIKDRAYAGHFAVDAPERLGALRDLGHTADWRSMFHTFDEFERAPELSFAIRGFLQNNGATMIGGLSDRGKTLIMLSITRALLLGKGHRLWGLFEVEEENARVIYLIPECSIEPFKHRLKLFGIYPYLAPDNERLLVRTLSKGLTPSLVDVRILQAAKRAHVMLDTAIRFSVGDENEAGDNRQLANRIFALLGAGARTVVSAHHAPKSFEKETVMRLENVLRGTGDIGAMLSTCWAIRQIDRGSNVVHIENVKPRDFRRCGPFQIVGRPHIDDSGDFRVHKRPGECGMLADELQQERDKGGASAAARGAKAAQKELLREWLSVDRSLNSRQLSERFRGLGIKLGDSAIRKYRKELGL